MKTDPPESALRTALRLVTSERDAARIECERYRDLALAAREALARALAALAVLERCG